MLLKTFAVSDKIKDGNLQKIIIKACLVILLLSLFLFLPLVNNKLYIMSAFTSKFIFFLYITILLFFVYSLSVLLGRERKFYISKLDIFLFGLVIYITFNRYIIQSCPGFSIRYWELICLSFLYTILRSFSIKSYIWILLIIVFSGILEAFYGVFQLFGLCTSNHLNFRTTGSFFNPGPFAGYLVSIWPVALGMYLFRKQLVIQAQCQAGQSFSYLKTVIQVLFEYLPVIGIFSIAIILPCTKSRASWIALVVSTLVLIEFRYTILKRLNNVRKICLVFILSAFLAAGLFGIYNFKKSSSDGRVFIGKVAAKMIADRPFFGFGIDGFKAQYMNYQSQYFAINKGTSETMVADNTLYVFNDWLQFIVENGLAGTLFLIGVIIVIFKMKGNQERRIESRIAKAGLLAIGLFACFSYPMQILPIKVIMVFFVTFLARQSQIVYSFHSSSTTTEKTIKALVCSCCIIGLLNYVRCVDNGFRAWRNAVDKYHIGDYKGAIHDYNSVYAIFKNDGTFLMNFGKTLSMAGEHHKAIVILKKAENYLNNTIISIAIGDSYRALKQYNQSEVSYQTAANMVPSQFYPDFLLFGLYIDCKEKGKAILIAKKIVEKKIKVPSPAVYEMRKEMKSFLMEN